MPHREHQCESVVDTGVHVHDHRQSHATQPAIGLTTTPMA
jgi:hypothetical protein